MKVPVGRVFDLKKTLLTAPSAALVASMVAADESSEVAA